MTGSTVTITPHDETTSMAHSSANVLSKADKKRIQNRLNQQAYRKREAEKAASLDTEKANTSGIILPRSDHVAKRRAKTAGRNVKKAPYVAVFSSKTFIENQTTETQSSESALDPIKPPKMPINADTALTAINASAQHAAIPKHIYWEWAVSHPESVPEDEIQRLDIAKGLTSGYSQRANPSFRFPLSIDHKIMVVQYNLYRAMKTNKDLLSRWLPPCPLSGTVPKIPDGLVAPDLQPTALQQILVHPPWVANFPHPRVRDNLVLRQADVCWEEIIDDLVGYLYPYHARCDRDDHQHERDEDHNDPSDIAAAEHGMIVWGEPWEIRSWEITPKFVRKYRWMLKGCQDLIESSNRWRASRGEPPILEVLD